MTTEFFQACQKGDIPAIRQQLGQNPALAGARANVTALTQAAQAGQTDVVRELLAHNADPRIAQALVSPTESNSEALSILREAALYADTRMANGAPPRPQQNESQEGNTNANLPPPEVARLIPCRFFPNCRYGDRCLFQHPTGPMMMPPQGAQPMFFPGPNGMPFTPAPGAYGVPPPQFVDMNHPMFQMYGPNGVPFYPQQPAPAPESAEANEEKAAPQSGEATAPDADADALANSMDTQGNGTDTENNSANAPRTGRTTNKGKNNKTRNENSATQRGRSNGNRPSCAFFARAACRYANDCRFPHILPDGTDARTLPNEDGKAKTAARRVQGAAAERSDSPGSPTGSAQGGKKTNARNARNANANSTRGKGARRGAAPASNRKTVQRVPNSDEFPALPGGGPGGSRTEANDGTPSDSQANTKPKANFSAILSAPPPPKPAKKVEAEETAPAPASTNAPASTENETPVPQQESSAQQAADSSSPNSRDFAAVVAAQPNAITA